jgi:hypothetical protein
MLVFSQFGLQWEYPHCGELLSSLHSFLRLAILLLTSGQKSLRISHSLHEDGNGEFSEESGKRKNPLQSSCQALIFFHRRSLTN